MNQPTPAIVAQNAVRRLPRPALWLFCLAYVLPGFIGREPWKSADMTAFGYMQALARGVGSGFSGVRSGGDWFNPQLMGIAPATDALLPYWLGAWAMQWAPGWVSPDFAARVPFGLLLALTLAATWYGTYYLALSPKAQPLRFAFGGEASAPDYARAIADGALLALIASLGLAQLSHETTAAAAQLCFTALSFYAFAALPLRSITPAIAGMVGLLGLALSGAPALAAILGVGSVLIQLFDTRERSGDASTERLNGGEAQSLARHAAVLWWVALVTVSVAILASYLDLWRWRLEWPNLHG